MNKLLDRLNGRVLAIVVALLLAAVATVALNDYVSGERDAVTQEAELVSVYVATSGLIAGTTVQFAAANELIELREVNRATVELIDQPITSLDGIINLVVATRIDAGEIVRASQFGAAPTELEAFEIPDGQVAMSVDVSVTNAVANFVDPGDRVTIVVHTDNSGEGVPTPEGQTTTSGPVSRVLLQDVLILAIGRRVTAGAPAGETTVRRNDEALTITVALTADQAEKLVFARFTSTLYLLLQPVVGEGEFTPAVTGGRNVDNLFER